MSVDKIIDEIDDILDSSWHLPLSGGKVIVDSKEMRCLLEDLRLKLPKEVLQAKSIVADRSKIIDDAKSEAENIMKVSEDKIKSMVRQSEIVKNAQLSANKIVSDAKDQVKEMKLAATEYIDEIMKQVDQTMVSTLSEIRKARQALRSPENKGN